MTRLKIAIAFLLGFLSARSIGAAIASPPPQESCTYDEACGTGMCKVWDHSRFVCEPKQYTVAVWDRTCIDKIEAGEEARVEAPVDDGEPDRKHSKLIGAKVTFKTGCTFRYEVRSR